MADRQIRVTSDFARYCASAKISCGRCGHKLIASPEKIAQMFPVPMQLSVVRYRLRCRACGRRLAAIDCREALSCPVDGVP